MQSDNLERFRVCFEYFVTDTCTDITGSIATADVKKVVRLCLGEDVPEFILDRFVSLAHKHSSPEGKIPRPLFLEKVVPKVQAAVRSECLFRRELPALLQLMNRPRLVDGAMGGGSSGGEALSTTYRDNFNRCPPEIALAPNEHLAYSPLGDPLGGVAGTGTSELNSAARVLCAGTTKGTLQLPGYKGHIPRNLRNERKLEHSIGGIDHPVKNHLRLTQRGMGCVLGYTGHVPHEIEGGFRERKTGCDPRTSNGAAYGETRAYL
jgi:hypothetical protein